MSTEIESIPASLHLRLVAKLAIWISLIAAVFLAVTLLFLANTGDTGYTQLIRAHSITQQNLGAAVALSALFLIVLMGIITWVLAMDVSFKLAGPFYRFSRNFEQASTTPGLLKIREGDQLQDICELLRKSNGTLHNHYADLARLLGQAEKLSSSDHAGRQALIAQIKEHCSNVRLD